MLATGIVMAYLNAQFTAANEAHTKNRDDYAKSILWWRWSLLVGQPVKVTTRQYRKTDGQDVLELEGEISGKIKSVQLTNELVNGHTDDVTIEVDTSTDEESPWSGLFIQMQGYHAPDAPVWVHYVVEPAGDTLPLQKRNNGRGYTDRPKHRGEK